MLQHQQEEIVWVVEAVDGVGVMSSNTPHVYVQEKILLLESWCTKVRPGGGTIVRLVQSQS